MRISRAQPIFSGKKRRHDAHSVETLYIFTPPQSVCSNICTPAWKQGNFIWERGNPLYARQSLAYLQTSHFPQYVLGLPPQDPALGGSLCSLPHLPSFPAENSRLFQQKLFQCLKNLVSGLQKYFRHFPDAFSAFGRTPRASRGSFSCFGSAPEAFPAHFQPLGAFPRLPLRISGLWERSHGFPNAFPSFGSVPKASPAHFRASGAFPRLPRRVFSLRERSVAAQCTALSFGGLPECSHRHCPRVARKSYKIFSSGG